MTTRSKTTSRPNNSAGWWMSPVVWVGALIVVALVIVAAVNVGGEGDDARARVETGAITVEGAPLPPFQQPDPAVGTPAPRVTGVDFDGATVQIDTHDGTARVIGFFAHWCPHCQEELPRTVDWLGDNPLPEGVELIAVSTGVDESRGNFPPSQWFDREEWPATVIVDSTEGSIASAFGLTAFPYWVVVNSEGDVVSRVAGQVTNAELAELVRSAALTS